MRLRLIQGKQKEIIEHYKIKNNLSWKTFSSNFNINKHVLLDLKHERNYIPYQLLNKISKLEEYEKYIIDVQKEGWGKSKGGKNSNGNTKKIRIPKKDGDLAELVGVILGDGHLSCVKGYKIGTYGVIIAGHSELDREYLLNFVKNIIERSFDVNTNVRYDKNRKVMWIYAHGKHLIKFFESIGLNYGNKIENNQGIPDWIIENEKFLKRCVRGLVDTDGSIHRMSNKDPNLLRITFTNNCIKLLEDFNNSLVALGFSPNQTRNKVQLSKKKEVSKFVTEIGFKNKKHINRLESFRANSPIV